MTGAEAAAIAKVAQPLVGFVFTRVEGKLSPDEAARVRRALAAAKSLAEEVEGVMGGGVMLHPPHARVAPKHGRTVLRAWAITPTAIFNLLLLPVTQVPLGLDSRGLPLGVQVAAPGDCDHVPIAGAGERERVVGGWVPPA